MEIMKWVATHVRQKSRLFYTFLIVLSIITIALLMNNIGLNDSKSPTLKIISKNAPWSWYILWIGTIFMTICIWFYYAPIVEADLYHLNTAFKNNQYHQLFQKYQGWVMQFKFRSVDLSWIYKIFYSILWLIFTAAFLYFSYLVLSKIFSGQILFILLYGIMALTLILLNFSSYHICIIFVYFLMRVYRLAQEKYLSYVKEIPSATYGFQVLNNTANTIYAYFLLDSFFCTISYFCFVKIIYSDEDFSSPLQTNLTNLSAFLYATFFMTAFGLISWLFIILLSRAYLHRLHTLWKLQTDEILEKKYQRLSCTPAERELLVSAKEKLAQDKISMGRWELFISLIANSGLMGHPFRLGGTAIPF